MLRIKQRSLGDSLMLRAPRTYEIPARRTEVQLLPNFKQGKSKEKEIVTKPLHERYDLVILETMVALLQGGYSLGDCRDYNVYVQGARWKTMFIQDGMISISFLLDIGLPFYFSVHDGEIPTEALLLDLLSLREDVRQDIKKSKPEQSIEND